MSLYDPSVFHKHDLCKVKKRKSKQRFKRWAAICLYAWEDFVGSLAASSSFLFLFLNQIGPIRFAAANSAAAQSFLLVRDVSCVYVTTSHVHHSSAEGLRWIRNMLLTEKSEMQTSVRVKCESAVRRCERRFSAHWLAVLLFSLCDRLKSLVLLEPLESYWRRSARKIKTEHKKTGFENAFHGRSARRILNGLAGMWCHNALGLLGHLFSCVEYMKRLRKYFVKI